MSWPKGKPKSEEQKRKLSEALRGRAFTDEHRANLSRAGKGKPKSQAHRERLSRAQTGRQLDEETRTKMSVARKGRTGVLAPNYQGGRILRADGYVEVLVAGRYVKEHRLVMEQHLGRRLDYKGGAPDGECVHHINGDRADNRLENLALMTNGAHLELHRGGRCCTE